MSQPFITNFYNKRKRCAESINAKSKVLVLDGFSSTSVESLSGVTTEVSEDLKQIFYKREMCVENTDESQHGTVNTVSDAKLPIKSETNKYCKGLKTKSLQSTKKSDIRLAFKPKALNEVCPSTTAANKSFSLEKDAKDVGEKANNGRNEVPEKKVVFELLGSLSPQKKAPVNNLSPIKFEKREDDEKVKDARRELGLRTPKKTKDQNSKEMSMFEIRNRFAGSSRSSEIRECIKNFMTAQEQLKELELRKRKLQLSSPQLHQFTSIDLEVPVSPRKANVCSPMKTLLTSPLKTPLKSPLKSPSKLPAYQRFAHLLQPGTPSLVLPYTYRMLGEIFRCADTVVSMFYNRKETVTFYKLKAGVQEMLRRNFTEHHLGQIKKVMPDAFKFSLQKIGPIIGVNRNKYELVIHPNVLPVNDVSEVHKGDAHSLLTPTTLVARREAFHRNLLELVKDHHEEFLRNLDPPVSIPRCQLNRWHPDFELDKVPAVNPEQLPQPPTEDKLCTAKEVLDRAKSLFGCNQRMEKALQVVTERIKKEESNNSQEIQPISETSSLLKGVPKALLDKIRARQAAKAMVAMTRTPAEDNEAMQLLRLPEIARILRNTFVAEKKSVLPLEVVLTKVSDSYREKLSSGELDQHIRLVMKVVPGWLQILHVRKTDYLKISKDTDITKVMCRLEKLAAEKNSNL